MSLAYFWQRLPKLHSQMTKLTNQSHYEIKLRPREANGSAGNNSTDINHYTFILSVLLEFKMAYKNSYSKKQSSGGRMWSLITS